MKLNNKYIYYQYPTRLARHILHEHPTSLAHHILYEHPTSLARHILYEHVVYVLYTLIPRQLLFVWRRTLFSVLNQICVPSVHSTVCCCLSDVTHCSLYSLRSVSVCLQHGLLLFVWRHTLFSVHTQICVPSVHSTVYCCSSDFTHCSLNAQICVPFVHSTVCCCLSDVTHCSRYTLRSVYRLSTALSAPEPDHKVRLCHAGRCKVEVLCKIGKKKHLRTLSWIQSYDKLFYSKRYLYY